VADCPLDTSNLVTKCMGSNVASYSCPSGNTDPKRRPDYVSENSVKCKSCSASTTITDLDPEQGKFWISLKWGPFMDDKGAFVEDDLIGYMVGIVDSKGRILGNPLGSVEKVKNQSSNNCCQKDMYSFTAAGTLPTGYSRIMIIPAYAVKVGNDTKMGTLPMGVLTDTIVDVTTGLATKVTGSFTLKVSHAKKFEGSQKVRAALREAVADTLTGIEPENVRITNVTIVSRRLEELSRRLASHASADAGKVKVEFEIVLPPTYTGAAIKTTSIKPAVLMTAINARVTAKGITDATVTEAPVIEKVASKSVGTPEATGLACRSATVGLLAAFVGLMIMFH